MCLEVHQKQREETRQDTRTFENDRRTWTPKVAKGPRNLVAHNMYHFRFISENIEFVCMPKIFDRVYFEIVPVSLSRCREFFIEMRVFPESQASRLVLDTAEVPQNLLNAWIATESHWNKIRYR